MIWNQKYKPTIFAEVIGNGEKIKQIVESGDFGNLLLFGKCGTGKSLSAEILVKHYGYVYEKLNASDERSIDVLRGKLKNFAMSASSNGKKKIIWLDEFEAVSTDFMDALRGFMDDYGKTNIFIATTNYLYKVPDPIKSRFTKIPFNDISMEEILPYLAMISVKENVNIVDEVLFELVNRCKGDIRESINKLEELHHLNREITMEDLKGDFELSEKVHSLLKKRNFIDARQLLLDSPIKLDDFVSNYHDYIMELTIKKGELTPEQTKLIIERFFECISVLKFSANHNIVVEWLLLKIMEIL